MIEALVVAVISGTFAVIVALIGKGYLDRHVGKPNGRGNIVQMNEEQLDKLEAMQVDIEMHRTKVEDDLRAYRADSAQQLRLLRTMIGGLKIDAGILAEYRTDLQALHDRVAYLEAFAENCSMKTGKAFRIPKTRAPSLTEPTDITD